jgi:hypothetical protein
MSRLFCRAAAAALMFVVAPPTSLHAQPASDGWEFTVAPYLFGASMSGTQTVRGRDVEVDLSASDIFSNLQFGAMGFVVARKSDWGVAADLMWTALGTSTDIANVDFDQGAFAFYGLRRLGPGADVTFGLRVNFLQGTLGFKGPLQTRVEQSKTWADPIVGLNLRTPGEGRVVGRLYTEIGGFGAGSDFAWQIFPSVGIRVGGHATLDVGYRWVDTDYESGEANEQFAYNTLIQGPILGFTFRF